MTKLAELQGDHRVAAYIPGQATAATADSWPLLKADATIVITGVTWTPAAVVTGAATNNFALAVQNKGQAGVGTTAVTATKTYASGTDSVAHDAEELTLSTTAANLKLVAGDVLVLVRTVNGTGIAMPDGLCEVHFQYDGLG